MPPILTPGSINDLGGGGGGAADILAVLDTPGDLLTNTAGALDDITRAALAADSAFSSLYQPLVSTSSNVLGADVTMVSGSTWYNGPTLTLAAGTWLLVGHATVLGPSGGVDTMTARLFDGSAAVASVEETTSGASHRIHFSLARIVSPGSITTYTIQVASNGAAGGTISATSPSNGGQAGASVLSAVKLD